MKDQAGVGAFGMDANSSSAGLAPLSNSQRSSILALIVLVTVLAFTATYFINRAYQRERSDLGATWFARGEQAFHAGQADAAAEAFRTALLYSPDRREYELRLAQALARAGRDREATAYFLTLLRGEPGDGLVNLELAHLAARAHNPSDAVRYYQAAIYGAWEDDATTQRRRARLELIDFLLSQHAYTQARSELIGLTADLPPDGATQAKVAGMFLTTEDYSNALRMFQSAMKLGARQADVYAGAGSAAYNLGEFSKAASYLAKAQSAGAGDPIPEMLAMAKTVVRLDPYGSGLQPRERANRAAYNFAIAGKRLQACAAGSPEPSSQLAGLVEEWRALARRVRPPTLARDPELMDSCMNLVFRIEQQTRSCAAPTSEDSALLLMERHRSPGIP